MSNALQAIPTEHGLSVLLSAQKEHAITYELVGALTHDATELSTFHRAEIETSYYDDNGVLTFILNLPIETDFKEYLHKITILDANSQIVIECATPKVALAKGVGGMVTIKVAVTGEAGEIVFKATDYITEQEFKDLYLPSLKNDFSNKLSEHLNADKPHPQYLQKTARACNSEKLANKTLLEIEQKILASVPESLPIGIPLPWPLSTPPIGWLECRGQSFDKKVFAKLAVAYSSGILPDLRGEFIRGWDNGRNEDLNRVIGSWQKDELRSHIHKGVHTGQPYSYVINRNTPMNGSFNNYTTNVWGDNHPNSASGGIETRPRNIAFMFIVKAT